MWAQLKKEESNCSSPLRLILKVKGGDGEMWRFKSCPKCRGDVFLDKDIDGWYEQCLQCSYTQYLDSIFEVREQPTRGERKAALSGTGKVATECLV